MRDCHYSAEAAQAIIRHERNIAAFQALGIPEAQIQQLDSCIKCVVSTSGWSYGQLWDDARRTVLEGKPLKEWIDRWNK